MRSWPRLTDKRRPFPGCFVALKRGIPRTPLRRGARRAPLRREFEEKCLYSIRALEALRVMRRIRENRRIGALACCVVLSAFASCVTESSPPSVGIAASGSGQIYPPWSFHGAWSSNDNIIVFQRPPRPAVAYYARDSFNPERDQYHIARLIRNQDGSFTFELKPAGGFGVFRSFTFKQEADALLQTDEKNQDGGPVPWKKIEE